MEPFISEMEVPILTTINKALEAITYDLAEREESVKLILLTMLTGEHIILLGPPGTAKSMIARRVSEVFKGFGFFEYLLTKFTVPEEIFGPLSLKALEDDRFERKVDGYLPQAHVTFLDEIFKANSSILNALLSLINERIFYNGSDRMQVPLRCLVGASNEVPREGEGLEALYDRFLVRNIVEPIRSERCFLDNIVRSGRERSSEFRLGKDVIDHIDDNWDGIELIELVEAGILRLRQHLIDRDIYVSDRRWKKAVKLIKVQALLCGRQQADLFDALVLKHVLWSNPKDREIITGLVEKVFLGAEQDDEKEEFLKSAVDKLREHLKKLHGGKDSRDRCKNGLRCGARVDDDHALAQCSAFVPAFDGGCLNFSSLEEGYEEEQWFKPAASAYRFSKVAEDAERERWIGKSLIVTEFEAFSREVEGVLKVLEDRFASLEAAITNLETPGRYLFSEYILHRKDQLEIRKIEVTESVIAARALAEKVRLINRQLKG